MCSLPFLFDLSSPFRDFEYFFCGSSEPITTNNIMMNSKSVEFCGIITLLASA